MSSHNSVVLRNISLVKAFTVKTMSEIIENSNKFDKRDDVVNHDERGKGNFKLLVQF